MKTGKRLGLDQIITDIKSGLNPAKISEKHNISKTTLDYSISKLKKLGCIEKIGYGTWNVIRELKEVQKRAKGHKEVDSDFPIKEIRGHAFIWNIEFVEPYNWFNSVRKYSQKHSKLHFNLICNGKVPRTILDNRKIWLTKKGLTIYEPLDFFGKSSFETKGTAVYEMDKLVKKLLKILNLNFKKYRFRTSREHYAMVKNSLAKQYNDKKEKMIIKNEKGTTWLWIDDSKGLSELEAGEPNVSRQVQNFWNNHKKYKFNVNADFVIKNFKESAKQIQKNAEHLAYHAENMRSHVKAIQKLGKAVDTLTRTFQKKNVKTKINESQNKLDKYL